MGTIAGVTSRSNMSSRNIPRHFISNNQIKVLSSNLIHKFNTEGDKQLGGLKFQPYQLLNSCDKYSKLDVLWKCKQLLTTNFPLWGGVMQAAFQKIISNIYFILYPICFTACLKPFCKVHIGMIQVNLSLISLLKIRL